MDLYINRRRVLQLAGGAAFLLAPIARARRARAADVPKRLILIYFGNGTNTEDWRPVGSGTDFTLGPIMKPLEAYKSDLIIPTGLYNPHYDHFAGCGSTFTFQPLGDPKGSGENSRFPKGISIDQAIVAQSGGKTSVPSAHLGHFTYGTQVLSSMSYAESEVPIPIESDMARAYTRFFGALDAGVVAESAEWRTRAKKIEEQRSVLDSVMADIDSLKKELSGSEKTKLELQLAAVRQMEMTLASQLYADRPACPIPQESAFAHDKSVAAASIKAELALTAALFACDVTRVVTIMFGPEGQTGGPFYPVPGFSDEIDCHQVSHHTKNDKFDPAWQPKLVALNQIFTGAVAELIRTLKLIPENGGTMFDNTLIYMTSGISKGDHSGYDMPCLLAGSCGGYFRTGRTIDYGNQKNISGLLTSIGNAMGLPIARFGDPARAQTALTGLTA